MRSMRNLGAAAALSLGALTLAAPAHAAGLATSFEVVCKPASLSSLVEGTSATFSVTSFGTPIAADVTPAGATVLFGSRKVTVYPGTYTPPSDFIGTGTFTVYSSHSPLLRYPTS